jgi:hypothetical protein
MSVPVICLIMAYSVFFGMWLERWKHRHWREMYNKGEAECWRCHGSGKEGR